MSVAFVWKSFGSGLRFLSLCMLPAAACAESIKPQNVLQLVADVQAADGRREADVESTVSTRRYTLKNKRWEKDAVMEVQITADAKTGKKVNILRMENAEGLQKRALTKIIEAEIEASRSDAQAAEAAITPANYDFAFLGTEVLKGRSCVVLQLKPKRSSKFLLEGRAWLDQKESAIVRVEGETAKSVSFWIGKPKVTQDFRKIDDIWVSAENNSVSDVRFLGRTELKIQFLDYQIVRRGDREIAQAQALLSR